MAGPVSKVSVILNGGIDEQGASELSGPIASQGGSPVLRRSRNTRLSPLRGTCVRPPACPSEVAYTDRIHGVVPCEFGQNSLVMFRHDPNRMLGPDGSGVSTLGEGPLLSQTTGEQTTPAAAFLPGRIDRAGGSPGEPGRTDVMSAYDSSTGWMYHAYSTFVDSVPYVVAYVTDTEGAIIATPRRFTRTDPEYLALTAHGANGVRLWMFDGTTTVSMGALAYVGDNEITLSETAITFTGSSMPFQVSVCSGEIVNSDGTADATFAQYAYMTWRSTADAVISRIDVLTGTKTDATVTGAGGTSGSVCVSSTSAGIRVGAAFQEAATLYTRIYTGALVLQQSGSVVQAGSLAACQWTCNPANASSELIVVQGATLDDGSDGLRVYSQPVASNTVTQELPLPWMMLKSSGGQVPLSSTERFALFDLYRYYGPDSESLLGTDYVADPDVQVWMWRGAQSRAPVVRFGCVRFSALPYRTRPASDVGNFTRLVPFGTGVWSDYVKDLPNGGDFRSSRWVTFSFPAEQPMLTYDRDGVTMAASAIPFEWDGVLPMEMGGPLYIPHLTVVGEHVAGTAWTAGDYIVAAHYEWTDAAGRTHRSAVHAASFTSTGSSPDVYVTAPTSSMRDGAYDADVSCVIYASTLTDTNLRRLDVEGVRAEGGWTFDDLSPAADGDPQIYSSGEANQEQMPQPPPPLFDVAIVADRAWGIDSEFRSRIVHSKRRVSGIGFEWHPSYEILLPSGAGPAMAVREWQGSVVVFAEYGIFGISGDGPDNLVGNPSGGAFSKPQRIADLGTTNHRSVVSTPMGIVFQRDEDMMLFTGGAPKAMNGPRCDVDIQAAIVLRDQDEVVLFFPTGERVWNYAMDRWTTWQLADVGTGATGDFHIAVELPYDKTRAIVVSNNASPRVHLLDSDTSGTLAMSWETDWLLLGGDFQDHVNLQHLVFSARRGGEHGVTVEIFTGYNESTASTTRTWTAGEITTLAASSGGRYTLKIQPTNRGTRAAKVRITETSPVGDGMRPISLTLYHNVEAGLMESEIKPGAFR